MLLAFRWCFTEPSFRTFAALVVGMVARPGRRTVCGMLVGAGLSRLWHHSRAHWFFSHARWSAEQVGLVLVGLIVTGLLPAGVPVLVAVDDTLLRRSGRKVAGAAWCYDGARKGPKGGQTSWGTCFVVVGIVVTLPMCDRPVCLPVLARLWRPKGTPKTVLACHISPRSRLGYRTGRCTWSRTRTTPARTVPRYARDAASGACPPGLP